MLPVPSFHARCVKQRDLVGGGAMAEREDAEAHDAEERERART
jgi:hypothetical protein